MPLGTSSFLPYFTFTFSTFVSFACGSILDDLRQNYFDPPPSPEDGPPLSAGALRDRKFLPVEIGGIIGAYALSLIVVAVTLLSLAKKRREHLAAPDSGYGLEFGVYEEEDELVSPDDFPLPAFPFPEKTVTQPVPNFSYKSPTKAEFNQTPYVQPPLSPASTTVPGVDPSVDPDLVAVDREMAQQQLEEMYKYVMEHEDAKERGLTLEAPVLPYTARHSDSQGSNVSGASAKKEKTKPSSLNLSAANDEKSQSRTSSFLSALRSPRKKSVKGLNISSPIMTPQSGTFPRQDGQELMAIPSRQYAPSAPPPIPEEYGRLNGLHTQGYGVAVPLTPTDMSPESTQSIDERLGSQPPRASHSKTMSQAPTEVDPGSATSEHSQAPLIGLPASPKPGARFPSLTLPTSPAPGARFQRSNAPSAVRTGGALPLRAYEPALTSPSAVGQTTKQTVFERTGPLSPMGGRTPMTAGAVPYSPYQPFTPCMPVTPSLVTKEDRKRMKRMVPKTPTLQMVQNSEDIW